MRTTGFMTIGLLLTLSLCGVFMACMDGIVHYALLAGSLVPSLTLLSAGFIVLGFVTAFVARLPQRRNRTPVHRAREPDTTLWLPLSSAFADGILNPKLF